MMRAFWVGAGVTAALAIGIALGSGVRFGGGEARAAERVESRPPRMGFVSCSELMQKSTEWVRRAKAMNEKRAKLAEKIAEKAAKVNELKLKHDGTADAFEKMKLAGELVEATRDHEDAQRKGIAEIDRESQGILGELHAAFEAALAEVIKERSLEVVFGCPINPAKLFKGPVKTPQELDIYFRPPAASPIHISPELDITDAIVAKMNAATAE